MKRVLISIQPKWCELIASGKKTVEVRKTKPKLEPPFKCYIYCTNKKPYLVWGDVFDGGSFNNEFTHLSGYNRKAAEEIWELFNGKVMGEFVCNEIKDMIDVERAPTCLSIEEWLKYTDGHKGTVWGWHISDLVIYDTPKPLSHFYKCGALTHEELDETLCVYCSQTDYGKHRATGTPNGVWMCEGRWCGDAYQEYLDEEFALTRPPQSWCYVEEV